MSLRSSTLEILAMMLTTLPLVLMEDKCKLEVSLMLSRCLNGTCVGVGINGSCARTVDCEPSQYCESGRCRNHKQLGDACQHKFECGRAGSCLFNNTKSYFGLCIPYFSIPPGNNSENRVLNTVGGYLSFDNDTRLLCTTGYMDSLGYCKEPPISLKAGKSCQYKYDCDTTLPDALFAGCQCTFNMKEPKYCDILQGNDEWLREFADFKVYWNATLGVCNAAARWQECGGKGFEYYQWQCSYYKAVNYVDYLYKKDGNYSMEEVGLD